MEDMMKDKQTMKQFDLKVFKSPIPGILLNDVTIIYYTGG